MTTTHQIQSRLAILLDTERVRNIQASLGVFQQQKDLMRPFCGSSFLGRQRHAEGVYASEGDGRGERIVIGDPTFERAKISI